MIISKEDFSLEPPVVPEVLIDTLDQRGLTLATAESLTGGALCARLVDVPGASTVLRGGICSYATELKHSILGVDSQLLNDRGPVDVHVAEQMAQGARALCSADIALSTTGVAGPGPAEGHKAGTVFVACASPHLVVSTQLFLCGDRKKIRQDTVQAALNLLAYVLSITDSASI